MTVTFARIPRCLCSVVFPPCTLYSPFFIFTCSSCRSFLSSFFQFCVSLFLKAPVSIYYASNEESSLVLLLINISTFILSNPVQCLFNFNRNKPQELYKVTKQQCERMQRQIKVIKNLASFSIFNCSWSTCNTCCLNININFFLQILKILLFWSDFLLDFGRNVVTATQNETKVIIWRKHYV